MKKRKPVTYRPQAVVGVVRLSIARDLSPVQPVVCPCCSDYLHVKQIKLTSKFADFFVAMVKASEASSDSWANMREFVYASTNGKVCHDGSLLWLWKLLEVKRENNEAFYRPTDRGVDFYTNSIKVQKVRFTARSKRWRGTAAWDAAHPPAMVYIKDCLPNYVQRMAGGPYKVNSRKRDENVPDTA